MTSPTAPYIDGTGMHAPTYVDVLSYLQNSYYSIYGSDSYLNNDSQDGQLLAIFALAISDANSAAFAVYNSFSPTTAQGVGLSNLVKINGLTRELATYSTVPLLVTGDPGTQLINAYATDLTQGQWNLPSPVTIPVSGQITVQATANVIGNAFAPQGTITQIGTPTRGWQTVTNPADSSVGQPVETDTQLKARQTYSTSLPATTGSESLIGAVLAVPGVQRLRLYENNTNTADSNGIPPKSIALVVQGGDPQTIANTIFSKKTQGCGLFGTTSLTVVDTYGVPNTVNFFLPISVPITVAITLTPLLGYTTDVGSTVIASVINYINSLPIGSDVILSKLYVPANLAGNVALTFNIVSIMISRGSAQPGLSNIVIAFNEAATASISTVAVTIG